ncbi:DNA polymerase-3 subunit epsilon [Flavobacterium gossypii]|jgi:exonuclease, DNA polymerase III, epsilon subunit family|uniref:DNA polymerase-3 subunit epsilon n=1 Tax=Flavobacterium gossypii TaxID=1646119 RepID=A0ABR6DUC9_9FLAO|nr:MULTISPECIES: 3'-5' exonuclease [Flavobacterium]MBA9075053.1 DNA polymerase-3 subunit epsilon [Flavobacterium gossypii]WDO12080.1 3'-5' exonuclease [Flavobacterium sp. WW92]
MLDWLKINKDYPQFWKDYLGKFENKSRRFVAFSTETTGLDVEKDVILSIGAVGIENNSIVVKDSFEALIFQEKFNPEVAIKNGILKGSPEEKHSEAEAIEAFVNYLGNAVLVGHRIHFDIAMINQALEKLHCGKLKNEALDVEVMFHKWKQLPDDKQFSLDELSASFKISKSDRHTASGDAFIISLLFQRLKQRLGL